jgi:hypothetical protein
MEDRVAYRFFSVPGHRLTGANGWRDEDILEPDSPALSLAGEQALEGIEYRDVRARDRLRSLLRSDVAPKLPSPGKGCSKSVVFARPPNDLPALLRMADQLDRVAKQQAGERALVWQCRQCHTRYAVPLALARNVAIRCERCGDPVELDPKRSDGEESLLDPFLLELNQARHQLSAFFREAMARGWPVLVCTTD